MNQTMIPKILTVVEYGHDLMSGHEVAVSAERFDDGPSLVWLAQSNHVEDANGNVDFQWQMTPVEARDLAASLLLAADAADGTL